MIAGSCHIAGDATNLAVRQPCGLFGAFDTAGEVRQPLVRCVGVAMVSGLYWEVYHASPDAKGPLRAHPGGSRRSVHRGLWSAADGDRRLPLVQRLGARMGGDGLLAAGDAGVQLTWMDVKVGDWVVPP